MNNHPNDGHDEVNGGGQQRGVISEEDEDVKDSNDNTEQHQPQDAPNQQHAAPPQQDDATQHSYPNESYPAYPGSNPYDYNQAIGHHHHYSVPYPQGNAYFGGSPPFPPPHPHPPTHGSPPVHGNAQAFAAGAAWAAAQIAAAASEYAAAGAAAPPMFRSPPPYPPPNQFAPPSPNFAPWGYPYPPFPGWDDDNTSAFYSNNNESASQNLPSQSSGQARSRPDGDGERDLSEAESDRDSYYGDTNRHRRKRQQRLPPPETESSSQRRHDSSISATSASRPELREKVRRRMRSDGESSSSGSSFHRHNNYNYNNQYPSHRRHVKKKKARSDESLLGKTALSALFEFCNKRHRNPVLRQQASPVKHEFEFTVALDHEEDKPIARGRGSNKTTAKQAAARRALEALLPNIVFDDCSGIVVQLPPESDSIDISPFRGSSYARRTASECVAEDLAPNLAKRLAIGRDNNMGDDATFGDSNLANDSKPAANTLKKRAGLSILPPKNGAQTKRSLDLAYPGTSTTSEEDEEDVYNTVRGATLCSGLLNIMVQIDARILDPPNYEYRTTLPSKASNDRRDESKVPVHQGGLPPVLAPSRGPFLCTARLRLHDSNLDQSNQRQTRSSEGPEADSDGCLLTGTGVGSTKREARARASTKLLSLLFPECETLAEVKEAAEAAREQYAASKATSKPRAYAKSSLNQRVGDRVDGPPKAFNRSKPFTLSQNGDHPIPSHILLDLNPICLNGEPSLEHANNSSDKDRRQCSRHKQVDAQVESALRSFNEHDDEGRSRPVGRELTVDDVGRTVLRRPTDDNDWDRIEKLFSSSKKNPLFDCDEKEGSGKSSSTLANIRDTGNPSVLVLLLCRAIAPHDDPPLGCAIITRGFSMKAGRQLRVEQIAEAPHLPKERFIECLEKFSQCMKCSLTLPQNDSHDVVSIDEQKSILRSHKERNNRSLDRHGRLPESRISLPLQSVKEESEVSDGSVAEQRKKKRPSQPSKRSRVE